MSQAELRMLSQYIRMVVNIIIIVVVVVVRRIIIVVVVVAIILWLQIVLMKAELYKSSSLLPSLPS